MSLTPGTQLGPYEIVSQLGAGGMGVVYEAKDPRLKRTVAIRALFMTVWRLSTRSAENSCGIRQS